MIILDATNKSLEIILAGAVSANQLPVTTHYTDITTTAYTPGSNDTQSNGATAVTIVAAPAASTQRHVESITVHNADTAAATVTIRLNNNSTYRTIIKVTLQSLYNLIYEDGLGWQIIDANGGIISGLNVSDTAYAASWDGVTSVSPSKNAVYDQMQLKLTGSYASAAEINAGAEAAKAIAPDQLKLSAPTLAGLTDSSLTASRAIFTDASKKLTSTSPYALVQTAINNNYTDNTGDGTAFSLAGNYWTDVYDRNGNFDATTGTFTAPITGEYLFFGTICIDQVGAGHTSFFAKLVTSNRDHYLTYCNPGAMQGGGTLIVSYAVIADMEAADTAYITLTVSGGTKTIDVNTNTRLGIAIMI